MSEGTEQAPKKRTGLIVFLTILVILLVAALAVFATLYFTGSDVLKFNKEDAKSKVVEEEKEEEATKTSKKSSKTTEKETNTKTDSKTDSKANTTKDLNSLITGGDKANKTTNTSVNDIPGTTSSKSKVPVSSSVFISVLEKNGVKSEKNQGMTGVNELYIGYADNQSSSSSYIKFDDEKATTEYYNKQRDEMIEKYSTATIKKDAGANWENLRITFAGTTSMIYMERVGNVLIAISTDDATFFNNMENMIKQLGY